MLAWDSDLSFFRVLRVYSTQKKRVAFNISKMLPGQGPEGEVGRTYDYFTGAHMCCVCEVCTHCVSSVCVYAWMCVWCACLGTCVSVCVQEYVFEYECAYRNVHTHVTVCV